MQRLATAERVQSLAAHFTSQNGSPRARVLLLVGSLSIFAPLCIDMYLPALPRISVDLHASASEVQLSLTTCLIGLACGQLVYGMLSDRIGRRPPLLVGLSLFVVASMLCAFAPNAPALAGLRFLQGLGGAAGIVISRAIVRDLFQGSKAVRVFSMLFLVMGCGPVLAPQIGSEMLLVTSWRGIFVTLAIVGAILLLIAATRIPETLATELRTDAGPKAAFTAMRRVGTSILFLQHALAASLGFGVIFAYVSGASFVIENIYHESPQAFGLLFAMNALGMIAASQVNARIVGRFGAARVMTRAFIATSLATTALLVVVITGFGGLPAVLICMFATLSANGFISPNGMALSLQDFPEVAGSAAALLGLAQFGLSAAVAPLAGLGGSHDALPMALAMAVLGVGGLTARVTLTRRARTLGVVSAARKELVVMPDSVGLE